MKKYQIWASFVPGDNESPTSAACFWEGQTLPDGRTMLDFEREFSEEEGEELRLLYEFTVEPGVWLTDQAEDAIAKQIFNVFMLGWFACGCEPDDPAQQEVH